MPARQMLQIEESYAPVFKSWIEAEKEKRLQCLAVLWVANVAKAPEEEGLTRRSNDLTPSANPTNWFNEVYIALPLTSTHGIHLAQMTASFGVTESINISEISRDKHRSASGTDRARRQLIITEILTTLSGQY